MTKNTQKTWIVTPVFEDVEAFTQLLHGLRHALTEGFYLVAVDDASIHHPLPDAILEQSEIHGTVIHLRRNLGHQQAIAIGLQHISTQLNPEDRVVIMDCDGEDRPESIPLLLQELNQDSHDVVVAARGLRTESKSFQIFYAVYKRLFRLLTGRAIGFGNFMALKPAAVQRLVAMRELATHTAATVLASKLRLGSCRVDRGTRYAGQSKMRLVGLVLHGFKALMVFAEDVLVRVGLACAAIASTAIVGALLAIILKTIGFATPGWFSLALGILLLTFIQTGALALITLMMTGLVKGSAAAGIPRYEEFIERVHTRP